MGKTRRLHTKTLKTNVVLDTLTGKLTMPQVCSKYEIHESQVRRWTEIVMAGIPELFADRAGDALREKDELIERLYSEVGQMKVELDWSKKKMAECTTR